MRLIATTAAVFLATTLGSMTALADGCGDACDCPVAKNAPHHMVTNLPLHPVAAPVVRHDAAPVMRRRVARSYYNYAAAAVVRDGRGHGEWRVAPNDGQVPGLIDVQPACCAAPAPMPGPCCAPMAYGPPPAYGPPVMYGPQPDAYAQVDDKGWTGGVGYNADGGGGGGGGFTDGFGQVHFANSGSAQNGPSYNGYGESFQSNPSVPAQFQPRLMGGLAPSK
jgi:hypothetical protein